jgi:GH35 family endo-1,4-beta-xylanase
MYKLVKGLLKRGAPIPGVQIKGQQPHFGL